MTQVIMNVKDGDTRDLLESCARHRQQGAVRCGDNGIFKGMPVTDEQKHLTSLAREV